MMAYRSKYNLFILPLLSTKRYFSQVAENLGARINQITASDFNRFEFYVPNDYIERAKIAELFRLLDERIAAQNKIIEKLETLIKGIVDFIFTYYKFTTIPFKDVYSCAGEGGTPATSNPEYYKSGTIPFIKIDDLQSEVTKRV